VIWPGTELSKKKKKPGEFFSKTPEHFFDANESSVLTTTPTAAHISLRQ
jgi:hypothetical protein